MSEHNETDVVIAQEALKDPSKMQKLVEALDTGARRERQHSAAAIHIIATTNPDTLIEHIDSLIDALNRPEAQTRWETLETLALLVDQDARACSKAIPEADTALFDEDSGAVRLGAMRFLCKLGATTASRSEKVWPLIDEGIQCYHGDLEFNDMLVALIEFSKGKLSDKVKASFIDRMSFDAENGKGTLQKRAQAIIDNLKA